MANYTDAATVAAALGLTPDDTLAGAVLAAATQLVLAGSGNYAPYPGQRLAIDFFSPTLREVVTITAVSGPTLTVTALANAHAAGAPVREVTAIDEAVESGSRSVDSFCRAAVSQEQATLTEVLPAHADHHGNIGVVVSKPMIASVASLSYQLSPADPAIVVTSFWAEGNPRRNRLVKGVDGTLSAFQGRYIQATVTYTGGYPTSSDEYAKLARAATVMAARFYKEKDSGFSDAIGSDETGALTYKKGMPTDVKDMLKRLILAAS